VAVGDDRPGIGGEEARGVVVGALPGNRHRRLRVSRLAVARGVAEVMEEHDRVRREVDLGREVVLAVVDVVVVAVARCAVEPEAVLAVRPRRRPVRAGEAVAVAHVDHDRRALKRGLHVRPGRVGAVDLDDVRGVLDRLGVGRVHPLPVGLGRAVRGAHDQHDLCRADRRRCGAWDRHGRQEAGEKDSERDDDRDGGLSQCGLRSVGRSAAGARRPADR
jgi:hypothetical protein